MENMQNFVDVDEFQKVMGGPRKIAKGTIYAAIKNGEIPSCHVGRRAFIPRWFVDRILNPPAEKQGA